MLNKKNFYINGKWVSPKNSKEINVIDPATENECAVISLANEDDVNQAVAAAKNAFESWSFSSKKERVELLEKLYVIYKKTLFGSKMPIYIQHKPIRKQKYPFAALTSLGCTELSTHSQLNNRTYHAHCLEQLLYEFKKSN